MAGLLLVVKISLLRGMFLNQHFTVQSITDRERETGLINPGSPGGESGGN